MTLEGRFLQALTALESWYADSVKAHAYDGDKTSQSKPGAVELKLRGYPDSTQWRHLWKTARNDEDRVAVVEDIEAEYRNLSHSPSQKFRYWPGTVEQKTAIARDERNVGIVAREFAVSERTVYRYRSDLKTGKLRA